MNGNRSKEISVIVISEQTRYCPLAGIKYILLYSFILQFNNKSFFQ